MKIIKKLILLSMLVIPLTLIGCGPGSADYVFKLSENYDFFHAGESSIVKKDVNYDSYSDCAIDKDIQKIWWNDDFICAIQKDNNDQLNYWIIDITKDEVLGPFTDESFKTKTKELNIHKNVKFKNPEKFRDLEFEQQ